VNYGYYGMYEYLYTHILTTRRAHVQRVRSSPHPARNKVRSHLNPAIRQIQPLFPRRGLVFHSRAGTANMNTIKNKQGQPYPGQGLLL
jgi:hypothetical protein